MTAKARTPRLGFSQMAEHQRRAKPFDCQYSEVSLSVGAGRD
jgi:hypothetical protein